MGLGWAYGIWDWDGLMGFGMGWNEIGWEWDFREWDLGGNYKLVEAKNGGEMMVE